MCVLDLNGGEDEGAREPEGRGVSAALFLTCISFPTPFRYGEYTISATSSVVPSLLPWALLEGRKVGNEVGALLGLLEAGEGHLGARHELLGVLQVDVEHVSGPDDARVSVGLAVRKALDGAGLAADDAEQVRANAVATALAGSVALGGTGLEELLALGDITGGQGFASLRGHDEYGLMRKEEEFI